MVNLTQLFRKIKPVRALVVGDFMIDRYTMGKAERVSPEAPVLVLRANQQKDLPGGAGNVVANLCAYQCQVNVLGRIGVDAYGHIMKEMLSGMNVDITGLLEEEGYSTIMKNRFISNSQQLLRVDFETVDLVSSEIEEKALAHFASIIDQIDVVAISDYAKGFLTNRLLEEIIQMANHRKVPVIVDPKGLDFSRYKGAYLIKPNRKEAYEAAGFSQNHGIEEVMEKLYSKGYCEHLVITRSEEGITLQNQHGIAHFPVSSKAVRDVTGAGDTVLATLALGIGNQFDPSLLIPLANVAAGIAVEYVGCMAIPLHLIARRILEVEVESKVLSKTHLHIIQETLRGAPHLLIFLNESEEHFLHIFQEVQQIASEYPEHHLLIYPRREYRLHFLSFLSMIPSISFILPHMQNEEISPLIKEVNICFSLDKKVRERIYPSLENFCIQQSLALFPNSL